MKVLRCVKPLFLILTVILAEIINTPPVFAGNEIKSVRIWIGVDGFDETQEPVLVAEAGTEKYEVENIILVDDCQARGPALIASESQASTERGPSRLCEVELAADEGFRFAAMEQKDIKLTGIQSICSKAVRGNAGTSLVLTVSLLGLEERLGEIGETFFSESGAASWEEAVHARMYQVQLYYEGKKTGLAHRTDKTVYDFSPLMTQAGMYHYKVTPVSEKGKKGTALDAAMVRLSAVQGEKNKTRWQPGFVGWQTVQEPAEEEKRIFEADSGIGSQQEINNPDYRYSDGLYPQSTWLELNGSLLYFDAYGHVQERQDNAQMVSYCPNCPK